MPTEIRCPSCNRQLKIPDNLIGKTVRCPGCQQTFTASAGGASPARPAASAPPARRPAPPPPEDEIIDEPPRPARRRQPEPEPEYEDAETEAYEEEEEERPRRRRPSAAAAGAVAGPAICLMITGGIDVLLGLIGVVMVAAGIKPGGGGGMAGGPGDVGMMEGATGIGLYLIVVLFGILILLGATRMKSLRSYGMAMTACILAWVPCVNCCLLGLPFGIWGLVVLMRPEVKEAFR